MNLLAARRRRMEAGLLALVALVVVGAYTLASLGTASRIPANIGPFFAGMLCLFVVAHLAVRKLAPHADPFLLPLVVLLNGLGYVFIARLDSKLAGQQLGWTALGVLAFCVTLGFVRRVRFLERSRYTVGLLGVVLLVLPLIPGVGREINGSRIWVGIGPVRFQPGEFAKIALAIFFAAYLVEHRELLRTATFKLGPFRTPDPKHLAPVLVAWGFAMMVMMFQRDLGSALLFYMLFLGVLWVATERVSYLIVGLGLFSGGAYLSWMYFSHVQTRVAMWLNPWSDAQGKGFHIVQSSYALAWGGVSGSGLGRGIAGRIPYQETDFIFAIIGEELGLAGATAVLVAFLLLIGSGMRSSLRNTDPFAKLLAFGLTLLLGFQAFLIMGGVIRLLPLTGVTLPFVSYGGSSLLANWTLVALLVRLSDSHPLSRENEGEELTTVLSVKA